MRSGSVCGLLRTSGMNCLRLIGGYKAYRNHIRQAFSQPIRLILLGGYTGSGKTEILQRLGEDNLQILDLEGLAHHKGSAFGHLNEEPQPSNEQFENNLYAALQRLDLSQIIIVENESRVIGKVHLPEPFFTQMRSAPLLSLEVPKEARIKRLIDDYAATPKEELIEASQRIAKKLGHEKVKRVEELINSDHFSEACDILLSYYDTFYDRGVFKRPDELIHPLPLSGKDMDADLKLIKQKIRSLAAI
jgi:tRNA 2-selenouridine synthase